MKFKIDENLPVEIAYLLTAAGHEAVTVYEQGLAGACDLRFLEICQKEERVLVSLDLDFADIQAYPPTQYSGIMVIRSTRQDKQYLIELFQSIISLLGQEPLKNYLWIVEEGRIRIRS